MTRPPLPLLPLLVCALLSCQERPTLSPPVAGIDESHSGKADVYRRREKLEPTPEPEEAEKPPRVRELLPNSTLYLPGMTDIEDPSGQALLPFLSALARVALQEPGSKVTVVQFGDSHTVADFFTGTLRRGLQRYFGDRGRGFLFPGKPFRFYAQRDVRHGGEGPWVSQHGLRRDAREPLGLGGIRLTGSSPDASVFVETCRNCESNGRVGSFEISFWRRPGGGWLQASVDGKPARVIDTGAGADPEKPEGTTGYQRIEVPDGPHRLTLRPEGEAPVDLFGITLERDVPGVSLDALGLNGAWVGTPMQWTWALSADQLAHRDPELILTWYGTNEVGMPRFDLATYTRTWRNFLARLRKAAPEASCLVLGPADRVVRGRVTCDESLDWDCLEAATWIPPTQLSLIIEAERAAAFEAGCAFWDARRVMGGPGIIELWAESRPPLAQRDRVHLTREGYERLANALLSDLLSEYDRFAARGGQTRRQAP